MDAEHDLEPQAFDRSPSVDPRVAVESRRVLFVEPRVAVPREVLSSLASEDTFDARDLEDLLNWSVLPLLHDRADAASPKRRGVNVNIGSKYDDLSYLVVLLKVTDEVGALLRIIREPQFNEVE